MKPTGIATLRSIAVFVLSISQNAVGQPVEHVLASQLMPDETGEVWPRSTFAAPNGFSVTWAPDDHSISNHSRWYWIATPTTSTAARKNVELSDDIGNNCGFILNANSDGVLFDALRFQHFDDSTNFATFTGGGCPSQICWQACSDGFPETWLWSLADSGDSVNIVEGGHSFADPTSIALVHRLAGGSYRRVTAVAEGDFYNVNLRAPRINSAGTIIAATNLVSRYTWTGSNYSAAVAIARGESCLQGVDAGNLFLTEDGSIVGLGQWDCDPSDSNPSSLVIFVKQPGDSTRIFFPPPGTASIGVQSEPFAAEGQPFKLHWAITSITSGPNSAAVTKLFAGLDLLNDADSILADWSAFEIKRATQMTACDMQGGLPVLCEAPSVGLEGFLWSSAGVDALGRIHYVRGIDDRASFDPYGLTADRNYEFVRYEFERTCPADFNSDSIVGDADFVIFMTEFGKLLIPPAQPICDLNFDGVVDDNDFLLFAPAYDNLVCP
ncbi:MAG: hypothetical protein ACREJD_01180 [Phycisphaerales bacterium]